MGGVLCIHKYIGLTPPKVCQYKLHCSFMLLSHIEIKALFSNTYDVHESVFNLTDTQKKSAPGQRAKLSDCKPSREQHSSGSFQTSALKEIIPHRFEDSPQEIPTVTSQQSCYCLQNPGICAKIYNTGKKHNA